MSFKVTWPRKWGNLFVGDLEFYLWRWPQDACCQQSSHCGRCGISGGDDGRSDPARVFWHTKTHCKRTCFQHLLLKNKGYSKSTEEQKINKTPPWWGAQIFFHWYLYIKGFHIKFSLWPGWIEHETWSVDRGSQWNRLAIGTQCGRSTSDSSTNGTDLFKTWWGRVVKMKMIVFVESLFPMKMKMTSSL